MYVVVPHTNDTCRHFPFDPFLVGRRLVFGKQAITGPPTVATGSDSQVIFARRLADAKEAFIGEAATSDPAIQGNRL